MANEINQYTADETGDPIKDEDLLDMDNEDGGGGFDKSKKITVAGFVTFIRGVFGLNGTGFTIPRFDNSGNLTDSPMTVGEPGVSVLTEGFGIGIAATGGVSLNIKGEGNDDSTQSIYIVNSDDTDIMLLENDGFFSLEFGTSINGFSNDGTLAANSQDRAVTEFAVKTYVDASLPTEIIGGVALSSSSDTNILDGTYVILADTTTVTSVTSGIGQDSNWTLEITQAGITNQKGVVTATVNLEKDGGGGANYDIAIFKNGSIIAESEQVGQKLESGGKGQSVTVMSIVEFSTSDTFDIRVSGNGTAADIFCGGGTLFIR